MPYSLAVIVDPLTYDEASAVAATVELLVAFFEANSIAPPRVVADLDTPHYGYYSAISGGVIHYRPGAQGKPIIIPGFSWSFTGSTSDVTHAGVIAHEAGHHLWRNVPADLLGSVWRHVMRDEAEVTEYGALHGASEDFAESVRLLVLNPDLLCQGRPRRWALMTSEMGLKPIVRETWREVLAYAHERIIEQAEQWVQARHKSRIAARLALRPHDSEGHERC